jgi:alkaline phosphatase D
VLHLGDYIYDYPGVVTNGENPNDYGDSAAVDQGRVYRYGNRTETISLADYRLRFRNYREDADLQLLHSRYAFINTWDDHETANDSYDPDGTGEAGGAENHNDNDRDEGAWEPRKAAAAQAYNEWLPITDVRKGDTPSYNDPRLDRCFRFGKLADLTIVDTRIQGRHEIANGTDDPYTVDDSATDRNSFRRILSPDQEDFMTSALSGAEADGVVWKLLGQQVMLGHLIGPPLSPGNGGSGFPDANWTSVVNRDQWDGFDADRERLLNHIKGDAAEDNVDIENVVVLTGDIHTSWAIDLVDDPRKRFSPSTAAAATPVATSQRYGVEFVTPSVTSPGLPDTGQDGVSLAEILRQRNAHMSYINFDKRGYVILDITENNTKGTWYHLNSILDREDEAQEIAAVYGVEVGTNQLADMST